MLRDGYAQKKDVYERRKMFDLFIRVAEKILSEKYAKGPIK